MLMHEALQFIEIGIVAIAEDVQAQGGSLHSSSAMLADQQGKRLQGDEYTFFGSQATNIEYAHRFLWMVCIYRGYQLPPHEEARVDAIVDHRNPVGIEASLHILLFHGGAHG